MTQSEKITEENQKDYWLGVGMLLFIVKHSRPDVGKVTRELSKATDDASPVAFKELLPVIKYVLDEKHF